jgi:hypothetical protein
MSSLPSFKTAKYLDQETWDALVASGVPESELYESHPFGPIIDAYTRAQAIEDGVLVDLTQPFTKPLVEQAGIKCHAAMTSTAWAQAIDDGSPIMPPGQSVKGRLWDVLMLFRRELQRVGLGGLDTDRVHFTVRVFDGGQHNDVKLWALIGPGDEGEPVLTIMLEGED